MTIFVKIKQKPLSMKKILIAAVALAIAFAPASLAQRPGGPRPGAKPDTEKKDEPEKPAPELKVTAGLFGVAQHEKDWYFDIPDSLLGRRILAVTRFVKHTPGASEYGGEMVSDRMIYWEKAPNGNLLLRIDPNVIHSEEGEDIDLAVKASSENPIVASLKPEKTASPGCTRVKVTSLFEGDNQPFSLSPASKRSYNLGGLKGDASFIQSIRTYPINTEVTTTKTFTYNAPTPTAAGPAARGTMLPAGSQAGVVTLVLNTSTTPASVTSPTATRSSPTSSRPWSASASSPAGAWRPVRRTWRSRSAANSWSRSSPSSITSTRPPRNSGART